MQEVHMTQKSCDSFLIRKCHRRAMSYEIEGMRALAPLMMGLMVEPSMDTDWLLTMQVSGRTALSPTPHVCLTTRPVFLSTCRTPPTGPCPLSLSMVFCLDSVAAHAPPSIYDSTSHNLSALGRAADHPTHRLLYSKMHHSTLY